MKLHQNILLTSRKKSYQYPIVYSLWSTEHPTLNNLSVQLKEKGKILDTQTVKYGIRSFSFDAEKGFILNGKKVLINGACVHHDDGVLGASAFDGWRTQKNPYDYSIVIDSCFRSDIQSMGRKPISHYREMLWNENTPLYMAVKEPVGYHGEIKQTMWSVWPTYESWTWKGWEGKPVEVEVYTHQPKVKLYLNDQLIGTKEVNRNTEYKAVFTVPYQKGTLRAEAGEESVTLKTAGEPARLKLTPDRTVMRADGQSLTYIIVEVVDQDGNLVPEAEIPCEATVKGAGKLLAFASANLKDEEPYPSVHSKTWKGRAMLVVRSSQKKGTVNVSIKSKLPIATLSLKTK